MAEKLTCRELVEFLGEFLDDTQPAAVRTEFQRHIAGCRACRDYLDSYRTTIRLAASALAGQTEPPPDAPPELIRAILAARQQARE